MGGGTGDVEAEGFWLVVCEPVLGGAVGAFMAVEYVVL